MKDDYASWLWRDDVGDDQAVRALAAEVCDLWEDDEVDDDAMSNLIVRLRKAIT
jgi:hypothetical protein